MFVGAVINVVRVSEVLDEHACELDCPSRIEPGANNGEVYSSQNAVEISIKISRDQNVRKCCSSGVPR